jgi:hypothetical protein
MKPTKLELRHLAAYLPYKVKMKVIFNSNPEAFFADSIYTLNHISIGDFWYNRKLLILRPLSDLFSIMPGTECKYVEHIWLYMQSKAEDDFMDSLWDEGTTNKHKIELAPQTIFSKLCEHHFDVFGLIEAGLAIDINTLKPE